MQIRTLSGRLASLSLAVVILATGGVASSAGAATTSPEPIDLSGRIYVVGERVYDSNYQPVGTVQDLIDEASTVAGAESLVTDLQARRAAVEGGSIYEDDEATDSRSAGESVTAGAAPARKAPGCENAGAKFPFHKFGRAAFGTIPAGVTKVLCGEYNSKGWNHAWYDHSDEYRTMSFASGGPADDHNTSEFMLMSIGSAVEFPINAWYEPGNNVNVYVTPVEIYSNMELWGSFIQKVLVGNQNEELISAYIT